MICAYLNHPAANLVSGIELGVTAAFVVAEASLTPEDRESLNTADYVDESHGDAA